MFFLILTVCATAAMDNCQTYSLGSHRNEAQCLSAADIYRKTLGDGADTNYRIECETDNY